MIDKFEVRYSDAPILFKYFSLLHKQHKRRVSMAKPTYLSCGDYPNLRRKITKVVQDQRFLALADENL